MPVNPKLIVLDDWHGTATVKVSTSGWDGTYTAISDASYWRPMKAHKRHSVYDSILIVDRSYGFPYDSWVEVTPDTSWGWDAVPRKVVDAVYVQAARWYHRKNAPQGFKEGVDGASLRKIQAPTLDEDLQIMVASYCKTTKAVGLVGSIPGQ
jgi:hypothetical protein